MRFENIYKVLEKNSYYIFSRGDVLSFYPEADEGNLKKAIYRWKKSGRLYSLKRGLYELTYPRARDIPDMYIANKLYAPSYVSLETAMSYYSIIPEVSMAVTSITTKPTRKFRNKHGLFSYRTIKSYAFTGYFVERYKNFDILIAEPEKALIDYLYFKTYHDKKFELKDERLDREALSGLKRRKLDRYAKLYGINLRELYAYL